MVLCNNTSSDIIGFQLRGTIVHKVNTAKIWFLSGLHGPLQLFLYFLQSIIPVMPECLHFLIAFVELLLHGMQFIRQGYDILPGSVQPLVSDFQHFFQLFFFLFSGDSNSWFHVLPFRGRGDVSFATTTVPLSLPSPFVSTIALWLYQCPLALPVSFGFTSVLWLYQQSFGSTGVLRQEVTHRKSHGFFKLTQIHILCKRFRKKIFTKTLCFYRNTIPKRKITKPL